MTTQTPELSLPAPVGHPPQDSPATPPTPPTPPTRSASAAATADPPALRTAVVLGNGPSARLLDFGRLQASGIASVGMNAAYRHWDRIGFRPTYYMCMDTVVIRSHAQRIAELIDEGRIQRFFLRNEFLQDHPQFAQHPAITWFDGLHYAKGTLFDTHWVTTGSWAIRWLAHLGHPVIATIGIDANYVELLAEAKRLGEGSDLRLELQRTPSYNPNYFFADYQQAGDRYNVPNDPTYQRETGGLVHIDALREARKDIARQGLDVLVFDASPISSHGVFDKIEIDRLLSGLQLGLVTSFFAAAPADEVTNNTRILLDNARNPDIGCVMVLFEGDRSMLVQKVGAEIAAELDAAEREGRVRLQAIAQRPDYLQIFEAARSLGREVCAATNADVLLDARFTTRFLAEYVRSERPFIALTRWNRTPRGLFIQGQVAHPPWQEVAVADLGFRQVNHMSFDAYLFDRRTPLPAQLQQVKIGTFGCDTTVTGLLRLHGLQVCNPCLRHQAVHIDEKIRNYASEQGIAQMMGNTDVLRDAALLRFGPALGLVDSLTSVERMRPTVASIGAPIHRLGRWHSLLRTLGASPWTHDLSQARFEFEKICFSREDIRTNPTPVIERLHAAMDAHRFLEIEIEGQNGEHFLTCFGWTPELNEARERLFRYDRQSVLWVEMATPDERRIHADILLVLRQCLSLGTGALASAPGAASLAQPVAQAAAWTLAPPSVASAPGARSFGALPAPRPQRPRLLVIDPTPVGHGSATGQVKAQFLGAWPAEQWLQVWESGGDAGGLHLLAPGGAMDRTLAPVDLLLERCAAFAPDAVYLRPVDSLPLLEFAVALTERHRWPLVVHIMDDWQERLRRTDPVRHARVDILLRRLLASAQVHLAISDRMSRAYERRYGGRWEALANGVDVLQQPAADPAARPPVSGRHPLRLRYMGGFADDMGAASLEDLARVVASLQAGHHVRLEVHTMPWYLENAQRRLGQLPGISVSGLVDAARYHATLSSADVLVIAYNFDEISRAYTGLSLANKLPECLAAGVALLAYGPDDAPSIEILQRAGCAEVVGERDPERLRAAVLRLVEDPAHRERLGREGRDWAAQRFALADVQARFLRAVRRAMAAK